MDDWMDNLKEDIERKKLEKAQVDADRQKSEDQRRQLINFAFSELEQGVRAAIPAFNQKMYQGQARAELRYLNNTLTGDHLIVNLGPVRYMVKMDIEKYEIEARAEIYSGDRWMPGAAFAPDITITTDGKEILVSKAGIEHSPPTPTKSEDLPRILLSALARAAS